ncbi:uncharacterized protein LOC101855977 [Aplysia californica]|uniref:Uncharacterized protein LOC101855977 n=1 Tax=Aplysia californica TaxID=6500 RepID=A0ABM0K4I8_APLCA|nr:uncharacterized protein LOC101855977 [Aplysia californica]
MASRSRSSRTRGSSETLDLVLVFGVKKLPIHLDLLEEEGRAERLNLYHLSQAVYRETQVEPSCQKIIFRGRTLFKPNDLDTVFMNSSLSSLGLRDGDRVMVLGRKASERRDSSESKGSQDSNNPLTQLSSEVDAICGRCEQHISAVGDARDLASLKAGKKCIMGIHEESMKLLEKIDSTPAREDEDYRKQRKSLVNKLQALLDRCEDHLDKVKQKIRTLEQDGRPS